MNAISKLYCFGFVICLAIASVGCTDTVSGEGDECPEGQEQHPITLECEPITCADGEQYNPIDQVCEPVSNDGNGGTNDGNDNDGGNGGVWNSGSNDNNDDNSGANNDSNNTNNETQNGGGGGQDYDPFQPQDPESAEYHSCESDDFEGIAEPLFILNNLENYLLALPPGLSISNFDIAGGNPQGQFFADGDAGWTGFILSMAPPSGQTNSAGTADWVFNQINGISSYSVTREGDGHPYITHDNFDASILNHVSIGTSETPGQVRDNIVASLLGANAGDLGYDLDEEPTADGSGIHAVYKTVYRTEEQVVIIGGVTTSDRQNDPDGQARFAVQDLAGGTSLALAGETMSDQCVSLEIRDTSEVDIIVSLDASGSMDDVNDGLINFADELVQILDEADVDWRVGVTGVDCHDIRDDEALSPEFRALWPDPDDSDGGGFQFPNMGDIDLDTPCEDPDFGFGGIGGSGNNGRLMKESFTTDAGEIADRMGMVSGTGLEYTLTMGIAAIDHSLPRADDAPDKIRTHAAVVVIAVTDENEQLFKDVFGSWISGGNDPITASQRDEMEQFIQPWLNYVNRPDINAMLSGLYWVPGTECEGGIDVAHGIHHMVEQTGGSYDSICSPDVIDSFGAIAEATQEIQTGLHLVGRPFSGSVSVDVTDLATDTTRPLNRSVVDGFDFDTTNNSLYFEGPSAPDLDERVVVPYLQWDGNVVPCSDINPCPDGKKCAKGTCG